MSATIQSLQTPPASPPRAASRRMTALSALLGAISLLMLGIFVFEPFVSSGAPRAPSWISLIDGWGTGALGLLATLIVPIAVGEGVCRLIEWRTGVRHGMLIWASTTLATAYLLSILLAGALSPGPVARSDSRARFTTIASPECEEKTAMRAANQVTPKAADPTTTRSCPPATTRIRS